MNKFVNHQLEMLVKLDNGRQDALPGDDESRNVFGVITYIINDARLGEFDDCPVM